MSALIIANLQIRRDAAGRFCLNDLHQASGGEARHGPDRWFRLKQTEELVHELLKGADRSPEMANGATSGIPAVSEMQPVVTMRGGLGQGTYAVKELVYAYAMWISAAFHLHVIRAYDAMVTADAVHESEPPVPQAPTHRADVLVAASRGFSTLLRVGRNIGMSRQRATIAANDATRRATGIDLLEELNAHDLIEALPAPGGGDELADRIAAWVQGRNDVGVREIISGLGLGHPEDRALQMRVSTAMRSLGWRKVRPRVNGQQVARWLWRAPSGLEAYD
jgi:hypothetical protein